MTSRLDPKLTEAQAHIDKFWLLTAYCWMRSQDYNEMSEVLRGEVLLLWAAQYLAGEEA